VLAHRKDGVRGKKITITTISRVHPGQVRMDENNLLGIT